MSRKPRVLLSQQRYLNVGSKGATDELWGVPVCVRTSAGQSKTCTVLSEKSGTLTLPEPEVVNAAEGGAPPLRNRNVESGSFGK